MGGARMLVLGLGNELVSDDGFGPAVAEACRTALGGSDAVAVESASVAGLNLLDRLQGFDRVLIIDVVQTGEHPPGTLLDWPLERASSGRTLGGSHQTDLATTLTLGRSLGYNLTRDIALLVAEAEDLLTIRESLTPPLERAVPLAVARVMEWVHQSGDRASSNEEEP